LKRTSGTSKKNAHPINSSEPKVIAKKTRLSGLFFKKGKTLGDDNTIAVRMHIMFKRNSIKNRAY